MSKKQKRNVAVESSNTKTPVQEPKQERYFCQQCQHRQHGAKAREENKEGWCPKVRQFVARKETRNGDCPHRTLK